jgi:hypothetical protein
MLNISIYLLQFETYFKRDIETQIEIVEMKTELWTLSNNS